jgi:hypothetical protein
MSEVDNFGLGALADSAVEGALTAIAENPELLEVDYPTAIGQFAAALAHRVADGGLHGLQAEAILADVTEVIATNDELFLAARDGLAQVVVEAVLEAAHGQATRVLAGAGVVATVRRVLGVFAARGKLMPDDLGAVGARVQEVVAAGLAQAAAALGKRLAQEHVPGVIVELIEQVASGEDVPAIGTPEFKELFEEIADGVTARAI